VWAFIFLSVKFNATANSAVMLAKHVMLGVTTDAHFDLPKNIVLETMLNSLELYFVNEMK